MRYVIILSSLRISLLRYSCEPDAGAPDDPPVGAVAADEPSASRVGLSSYLSSTLWPEVPFPRKHLRYTTIATAAHTTAATITIMMMMVTDDDDSEGGVVDGDGVDEPPVVSGGLGPPQYFASKTTSRMGERRVSFDDKWNRKDCFLTTDDTRREAWLNLTQCCVCVAAGRLRHIPGELKVPQDADVRFPNLKLPQGRARKITTTTV
jgi:hypothetical protein